MLLPIKKYVFEMMLLLCFPSVVIIFEQNLDTTLRIVCSKAKCVYELERDGACARRKEG